MDMFISSANITLTRIYEFTNRLERVNDKLFGPTPQDSAKSESLPPSCGQLDELRLQFDMIHRALNALENEIARYDNVFGGSEVTTKTGSRV